MAYKIMYWLCFLYALGKSEAIAQPIRNQIIVQVSVINEDRLLRPEQKMKMHTVPDEIKYDESSGKLDARANIFYDSAAKVEVRFDLVNDTVRYKGLRLVNRNFNFKDEFRFEPLMMMYPDMSNDTLVIHVRSQQKRMKVAIPWKELKLRENYSLVISFQQGSFLLHPQEILLQWNKTVRGIGYDITPLRWNRYKVKDKVE